MFAKWQLETCKLLRLELPIVDQQRSNTVLQAYFCDLWELFSWCRLVVSFFLKGFESCLEKTWEKQG